MGKGKKRGRKIRRKRKLILIKVDISAWSSCKMITLLKEQGHCSKGEDKYFVNTEVHCLTELQTAKYNLLFIVHHVFLASIHTKRERKKKRGKLLTVKKNHVEQTSYTSCFQIHQKGDKKHFQDMFQKKNASFHSNPWNRSSHTK